MTNIKVVVGSNFGDEGKGMMTDYFCNQAKSRRENCLVVCSNGGSQRGHTVSTPEGIRHVFSHFGSGSFVGADTYLSKEYILNPMNFKKEWDELDKVGIIPKVFVHRECIFTTPFDMIINQIVEESRGDNRHGSCGMGIWETIVRNETVKYTANYYSTDTYKLKYYLEFIRDRYLQNRLKEYDINKIPEEWKDIIYSDILIENYISDFMFMISHITFTDDFILKDYQNIVFENGQGLLLDQNIKGYGEHTTPSNTGLKNPKQIIQFVYGENANVEVCYVTRTYLTRHGAGRFDTECPVEEINPYIVDHTNVYNPHQGNIRYGKINLGELLQRICDDFGNSEHLGYKLSLAITHLNETDGKFVSVNNIIKNFSRIKILYQSDGMTRESIKKI